MPDDDRKATPLNGDGRITAAEVRKAIALGVTQGAAKRAGSRAAALIEWLLCTLL